MHEIRTCRLKSSVHVCLSSSKLPLKTSTRSDNKHSWKQAMPSTANCWWLSFMYWLVYSILFVNFFYKVNWWWLKTYFKVPTYYYYLNISLCIDVALKSHSRVPLTPISSNYDVFKSTRTPTAPGKCTAKTKKWQWYEGIISNISEFLTKFIPVRSNFTLFKFQDSGFLLVFHFNGHLCHQKSLLPRQSYIFCSPICFIPQIWQLMI